MTLYMPLFRTINTLKTLTQLHAHLLVTGLQKDPLASTKLVESYAQMGSLQSSRLVFDTFPSPDSFMWGVLIKSFVWNHFFEDAISLYHKMMYHEIEFNGFIFPSILRACSGFGDLRIGEKVHGRIIKTGFDSDSVVETSLLSMYGELGCLYDAWKLFDEMLVRDVVSWSSIILCSIENGEVNEGLNIFRLMVCEGVEPDSVTMLSVAEACGELGFARIARSVHGYIVRRRLSIDGSLGNSLLVMYANCGEMRDAEKMFENLTCRSTSSWTAMISCYNHASCFYKARDVFVEMQECEVEPNSVTLMGILCSCARLGLFKEGKSVHCIVIRKAVDPELDLLGPVLIELYTNFGKQSVCNKVLHFVGNRNIVSWNMLISIYAQKGLLKEALLIFAEMHGKGLMPDSFSLASSLSACGNVGLLQIGEQIHIHIIKRNYIDEYVQNSLIDMYSKCGFVDLAYTIFENIASKSVVTWNAMLCGFSQNGNSVEAIGLFNEMYWSRLEMNQVTFLSVIQACSHIGYLEMGKWIHHKLITYGLKKDLYIETALTDMYAKCGDLKTAQRVFDTMSEKSIVSWSTMISCYGMHGKINAVITLFNRMIESGMKPNNVTFMNILSACSHAGLVKEGRYYFNSMRDFGIEPEAEHFACIIDILSRAGEVDGAYEIITSMSFPIDASIWGTLLNGCRIYQRMDMIKRIEQDIFNISTNDTGNYTLLSNIYAEGGEWNEFGKVRSMMKDSGLTKVPGYSMVEIDKRVYRFGAGDTYYLQTEQIYRPLENFQSMAQEEGSNVECFNSMANTNIHSEYDGFVSYLSITMNQNQSKNSTRYCKEPS